jgi:hypothetical protein
MGQKQSTCGPTSLAGSPAICYAEATPGIDTWLTNGELERDAIASLSETEKTSIKSRNFELREALGLTDDGRNNTLALFQTRYYTDCSDHWEMSTRWVTGGTIFPVFYMPDANDIDNSQFSLPSLHSTHVNTINKGFDEAIAFNFLNATHYGWSLASHARLTDSNDPAKQGDFPYGKRTQNGLTHLHKAQGFYGITIPCDSTTVNLQKPKAIVINQLAYPGTETGWKDGPLVPFTRMVFMFVLGEYEYTRPDRSINMKYRVCTAWRDFIMQEVVFLDFCHEKPFNDGSCGQLRNFFGQVASMNETYGWHQGLAIGKPKVWSDALSAMQGRVATISGFDNVKRAQLSTLMSKYVFRIPPDVRTVFLPDDEIRSGDEVQFVFDWPTCRRLAFDYYSGFAVKTASFTLQSYHRTIKAKGAAQGAQITQGDEISLEISVQSPILSMYSSHALKLIFTGVLKSGMRVQIHDAKGPLGIAHALTPAAQNVQNGRMLRTDAAVINLDSVALQTTQAEHLRNWIVYKKRGVSAVPVSSGSPTALDATQIVFKPRANPRRDTAWGCADKDPNDATKNFPNSSHQLRDAVEVACMVSDSCVGYYSSGGWHIATNTRPLECKETLDTGYTHFYDKTRVAPAAPSATGQSAPAVPAAGQSATGQSAPAVPATGPSATGQGAITTGQIAPAAPSATGQSASAVPATGPSATGQSAPAVPATGQSATTTTGPSAATTTGPISTAASVAVVSGDWGVSYALTQTAVADASLFSIGAVAYFGDKEKTGAPTRTAVGGTTSTSTSTGTKRPLLGHTLSALVRSAVAYDAVEHPTLLSKIPRPSTIDDSDASALGVLAVVRRDASGRESAVDFVCLASNERLAQALTALPSSRTLTAVSFAQMQLVTDFTASYFMASKTTKLGTVVCRAFRLVPYNIAAVVVVIVALVSISMALSGEQGPATRVTRVFRSARKGAATSSLVP